MPEKENELDLQRTIRRSLGVATLATATILFIVVTVSINTADSMGGPMSMLPSAEEWLAIALVIDLVLLGVAYASIKVCDIDQRVVGSLSLFAAIAILSLGVRNHLQAPPMDGINVTNKMPVPSFLHYVVYGFGVILSLVGFWVIRSFALKKVAHEGCPLRSPD